MKVLISDIPEGGLDLELDEEGVRAHLNIQKVGTEVVVKGGLRADVELQCSRCLKDFKDMIAVPVDVVYHPVEELRGEDKHEIKSGELDVGFYSGEELDLLDLVREQITLNLPMKPLCNDLCKGICVKCGMDLNTGSCGCSKEDIDPRLAALKRLLDKGA